MAKKDEISELLQKDLLLANKSRNRWKVAAIIFIILFVLSIMFFIWIASIGTQALNTETKCRVNVCGNEAYDSFYYDSTEGVCYCYYQGQVAYQTYLGDE
jgi:hypothetical protein